MELALAEEFGGEWQKAVGDNPWWVSADGRATFHGPRPEGCEVRHLDGDRNNNAASNLAWGTRSENHADKRQHGTSAAGERNPMAKLTREVVEAMRAVRKGTGMSHAQIGRCFGVSTMTAYRAVEGHTWK